MSRGRQRQETPREITELGKRIEHWRTTREKRSPMPEALWQEATRLARTHGVSPVSRHCGLGFATLQKRAGDDDLEPRHEQAEKPGFVELSAAQLFGTSVAAQTVLKLTDQEGTRLTLRLAPGESVDVLALVEGFRGRDR